MKKLVNYVGQLRLYSLVDLMLLLCAAEAKTKGFMGALLLWVGFLAYLELVHKDKGREQVAELVPWAIWLSAIRMLGSTFAVVAYIILSILYTWKKRPFWGMLSPFLRGAQTLVMVGMFTGYWHWLPWVAAGLMAFRNLLGDLRDSQEDADESIRTWPVVLKMRSLPFVHLLGTFLTTCVWWKLAHLQFSLLMLACLVEAATYWITPRPSNERAALRLLKIFCLRQK